MLKLLIAALLSSPLAHADIYSKAAPMPITKVEALKTLLNKPKAIVYKCYQVELNDKASLVKKKKNKKLAKWNNYKKYWAVQ